VWLIVIQVIVTVLLRTDRTIRIDTKLLATLWTLATPESFRSVSDCFNLAKTSLHGAFMNTCNALCGLHYDVIKMPLTATEMCSIADGFCTKTSFPLSLEQSTGRT